MIDVRDCHPHHHRADRRLLRTPCERLVQQLLMSPRHPACARRPMPAAQTRSSSAQQTLSRTAPRSYMAAGPHNRLKRDEEAAVRPPSRNFGRIHVPGRWSSTQVAVAGCDPLPLFRTRSAAAGCATASWSSPAAHAASDVNQPLITRTVYTFSPRTRSLPPFSPGLAYCRRVFPGTTTASGGVMVVIALLLPVMVLLMLFGLDALESFLFPPSPVPPPPETHLSPMTPRPRQQSRPEPSSGTLRASQSGRLAARHTRQVQRDDASFSGRPVRNQLPGEALVWDAGCCGASRSWLSRCRSSRRAVVSATGAKRGSSTPMRASWLGRAAEGLDHLTGCGWNWVTVHERASRPPRAGSHGHHPPDAPWR